MQENRHYFERSSGNSVMLLPETEREKAVRVVFLLCWTEGAFVSTWSEEGRVFGNSAKTDELVIKVNIVQFLCWLV